MDKMAEDNVYANVAIRTGNNKGFQPQKRETRRSKVTVERVALVVVSLLLVAAVTALIVVIMYYNSQTKGRTEEMERTTAVPHTSSLQPVSIYGSPRVTACSKNTAQCDEDWELHGEKCYYFSPVTPKLSWNDSKRMCQWLKGNLVKIDSREEQDFLNVKTHKLMSDSEDKFWIGLTDSVTEGVWLWTDGSPLNKSLTFWGGKKDSREPDNWTEEDPQGEDCVRMGQDWENEDLSWFDRSCLKEQRSICEKPARNS